MKIMEWLRPREATVEELEGQVERAREMHANALEGVRLAQAELDETGTDSAAKAVLKAKDSAAMAEERIASAERLLEAAKAARAAEERAKLEARKRDLEEELSRAAVDREAAIHDRAEGAALLAFFDARARRLESIKAFEALARELRSIRGTLGEDRPAGMWTDEKGRTRSPSPSPESEVGRIVNARAAIDPVEERALALGVAPSSRLGALVMKLRELLAAT